MKKIAMTLALAGWAGLASAANTWAPSTTTNGVTTGGTGTITVGTTATGSVTAAGFGTVSGSSTIVGTPHDLSPTGGVVQAAAGQAQSQVCIYCHMPHNANNVGAPLWNRVNSTTAFQMYSYANSSTFVLTSADLNTAARPVNPVSLACLSCHDGQTAFNSLNQAPMIDSDNGIAPTNYTFTVAGSITATSPTGTAASNLTTLGDVANAADSANLGTDLTNDHPISFTYNTALATLKGSTLFDPAITSTAANGGNLAIYRAGDPAYGGIDTIAIQMLFTKPGAATPDQLECASCHEPHAHGSATDATSNFPYLIKSNYKSQLCLTCHNK